MHTWPLALAPGTLSHTGPQESRVVRYSGTFGS